MTNSETNNIKTSTDKSVRKNVDYRTLTNNTSVENKNLTLLGKSAINKLSSKIYFITTPKPYNPTKQVYTQPKTPVTKVPSQVNDNEMLEFSTFQIEPKIIDEGISINININDQMKTTVSKRLITQTTTTTTTTSTTTTTTTTTSTTTTTTVAPTTTTDSSLLMKLLKDQGPQALGVGVASFAYTALAAMPYWLPFVAGRKRRSIVEEKYIDDNFIAKLSTF